MAIDFSFAPNDIFIDPTWLSSLSDPLAYPPTPVEMSEPSTSNALRYEPYQFEKDTFLPHHQSAPSFPPPRQDSGYESSSNVSDGSGMRYYDSRTLDMSTNQGMEARTVGDLLKAYNDKGTKADAAPPSPPSTRASSETAQNRLDHLLMPEELPFVTKLRRLLSLPEEYCDAIGWDGEGKVIIIAHKNQRWQKEILPATWGHSNYPSFTRQLNVYGFERIPISSIAHGADVRGFSGQLQAWRHAAFTRDDPDSSVLMRPRPSKAREIKKLQKKGFKSIKTFEHKR